MPESTSPSPARGLLRKYGIPAGIAIIVAGGAGTALASQAQPAAHTAPSPTVSAPVIGLDSPTASATASAAPTGTATPSASAGGSWGVSTTTNGGAQGGASASATAIPAGPKYNDGATAQGPTLSPWKQTAQAFAKAWADPSGGKDAWLARMAPYVTPDLLKQFGYTNISNVHADTLKGVFLEQDGGSTLRFSASFDNQGYAMDGIMVVQHDGTWRVSQIGAPSKH